MYRGQRNIPLHSLHCFLQRSFTKVKSPSGLDREHQSSHPSSTQSRRQIEFHLLSLEMDRSFMYGIISQKSLIILPSS